MLPPVRGTSTHDLTYQANRRSPAEEFTCQYGTAFIPSRMSRTSIMSVDRTSGTRILTFASSVKHQPSSLLIPGQHFKLAGLFLLESTTT